MAMAHHLGAIEKDHSASHLREALRLYEFVYELQSIDDEEQRQQQQSASSVSSLTLTLKSIFIRCYRVYPRSGKSTRTAGSVRGPIRVGKEGARK